MDLIPFKFQNERQNLKKKKPSGGMRLRRYAGILHQLESKQEIDGILKLGKLEGFFFPMSYMQIFRQIAVPRASNSLKNCYPRPDGEGVQNE